MNWSDKNLQKDLTQGDLKKEKKEKKIKKV